MITVTPSCVSRDIYLDGDLSHLRGSGGRGIGGRKEGAREVLYLSEWYARKFEFATNK